MNTMMRCLLCLGLSGFATAGCASIADALAERAEPIRDVADVEPLVDEMHGARLILMGEASHGTHEFYEWRRILSQKLIERGDVAFIAVEGDFDAWEQVDRYVRLRAGAGENAETVLRAFSRWPRWMWANEEVVELVEWLRSYNERQEEGDRVAVVGMDVYGLWRSLEALLDHLEANNPERHAHWERRLSPLLEYFDDPQRYVRSTATGGPNAEEAAGDLMTKFARQWSQELEGADRRESFGRYMHARVVRSGEAHYRASARQGPQNWNLRVQHMNQVVQYLLEKHGADAKGIVWAHNTHIGDARATDMARRGMQNIGQLSREAMGRDAVFALGFSTHRGTVMAGNEWQSERSVMQVPEAKRYSMDDRFYRLDKGDFWITWGDREALPRDLRSRRHGHRAIGVTYNPAVEQMGNYVQTVFPDRYDAVIFIEETRALTPLHARELE